MAYQLFYACRLAHILPKRMQILNVPTQHRISNDLFETVFIGPHDQRIQSLVWTTLLHTKKNIYEKQNNYLQN